ncbi:MAG: hypothetical protein AAF692_05860 [Pseudomonadota bacterium]
MSDKFSPPAQIVHLAPGAQAAINGALVSAREACTLEVAPGAYVHTGRSLWPSGDDVRGPREELYFSLLECGPHAERFEDERVRLFGLVNEVAARDPAHEIQRECARCVAALMSGDAKAAVECAARLASSGTSGHSAPSDPVNPAPDRRHSA